MTIATELHHVAHLGHDVYEQCPACRAAIMIGMGATVAAVIYGGGNADTLVKWVGTFTTISGWVRGLAGAHGFGLFGEAVQS